MECITYGKKTIFGTIHEVLLEECTTFIKLRGRRLRIWVHVAIAIA